MTSLLQYLPPITSSNPSLCNKNLHNCKAVSSITQKTPRIVAGYKPQPKTKDKTQEDDYHATLKALKSKGRTPRKSLGQHYMLNGMVNERLVAAANVGEGDLVLEIGPGTGSLTNVLVESGATVLGVEKDPYMAALVRERFSDNDRVKVLEEDITRCHVRSHLSPYLGSSDGKPQLAKVVANIPFNVTTDIVKLLLPMGDIISEVVLLLQEEAALRFVDPTLRTTEYRPVNSAFNGKRKMLRRSLQHLRTSVEIEEALGNVGLPTTSRPAELTLEEFVKLHNLIVKT